MVTYQRLLLRLCSSRLLGKFGERTLRRRVWLTETGEGKGLKLKFPQNADFIRGTSEVPVQAAMAQHIQPGDVVYDVGANVGFFSLIAARLVGPEGRVCSFEPVTANAASIRDNVALNAFPNVQTFEVAVGREAGSAELLLTEWDGGSTLASSVVQPSRPVSRRTTRVIAMDEFIEAENLRPPSFVKIDVEGLEMEVLEGMARTLEDRKPILLFEIDDGNRERFERRWRDLDGYVSRFGYQIIHLKDSYANALWNVGHTLALPRISSEQT
jgi:FkbM family methyltransferase